MNGFRLIAPLFLPVLVGSICSDTKDTPKPPAAAHRVDIEPDVQQVNSIAEVPLLEVFFDNLELFGMQTEQTPQPLSLPVIKAKMNGVEGTFLIDTGATVSVITDEFAIRADLKGGAKGTFQGRSNLPLSQIQTKHVETLNIGEIQFSNFEVLLDPFSQLDKIQEVLDPPIDGLLGIHLFEGKCIEFDMTRKVFRVYKDPYAFEQTRKTEATWMPLRRGESSGSWTALRLVEVNIDDNASLFLLDTGATVSLMDTAMVNQLLITDGIVERDETVTLDAEKTRRLVGKTLEVDNLYLGGIDVGPWALSILPEMNSDYPLLGSELLKRFSIVVDLESNRMSLRPISQQTRPAK